MAKPKIEKIYNSNGELNAIVKAYSENYIEINAFNIENPQEYIKALFNAIESLIRDNAVEDVSDVATNITANVSNKAKQ